MQSVCPYGLWYSHVGKIILIFIRIKHFLNLNFKRDYILNTAINFLLHYTLFRQAFLLSQYSFICVQYVKRSDT